MLQQLLRLGALADVPDDLQWTARMLLPKSAACPQPAEPRNPPQQPAPPVRPPAAWAHEPGAAAAPHGEATARPAAPHTDAAAPALQPLPLPAGSAAYGAPQPHAIVSSLTALNSSTMHVLCTWLRIMLMLGDLFWLT